MKIIENYFCHKFIVNCQRIIKLLRQITKHKRDSSLKLYNDNISYNFIVCRICSTPI